MSKLNDLPEAEFQDAIAAEAEADLLLEVGRYPRPPISFIDVVMLAAVAALGVWAVTRRQR